MKIAVPYHDPILDWHVGHCIKGNELKIAAILQSRGGETAVPMGKGRDNWRKGKKVEGKEYAALEGYVFYRGIYARKDDGIIKILDGVVSDKIVQAIMARYYAGEFDAAKKAVDAALKMTGKMVKIDHRHYGKMEAKIVRILPNNQFEIQLDARTRMVGIIGVHEIIG